MKLDVILGLQWGDEGKGKIVDFLAPKYEMIARFQGGPNAGHTLKFGDTKHVLHQIPSGIFRSNIQNLVGNGVVLDPVIFKDELSQLKELGKGHLDNLQVSRKAHLILPTHRLLDAAYEKAKGKEKIGSTLKGIGPTYGDKVARQGLRVGDIETGVFEKKYQILREKHLSILDYHEFPYDELEAQEVVFFDAIEFMRTLKLADAAYLVNDYLQNEQKVLAEGAQGTLLDLDFGSYPFVTSSTTMTAGVCTGLGVAPSSIGEVFGIFKSYCTRVGAGPFPTELVGDVEEKLRQAGGEFGATTGRPRRCGWLDLPALKYACMINGVTQLFMMKADVLDIFDEIKICTHYIIDGEKTDRLPYNMEKEVTPIYESFKGWTSMGIDFENFDALPDTLKTYIEFIEKQMNLPINIVSLGPDRSETIIR